VSSQIEELRKSIAKVHNAEDLEKLRLYWVGRKGIITLQSKALKTLDSQSKAEQGRKVFELRRVFEELFQERQVAIEKHQLTSRLQQETFDITYPKYRAKDASHHPISKTIRDIVAIFKQFGFNLAIGPEIENQFYNFEALNFSSNHSARDMHDTFYLNADHLLRTHTSPVQIRTMLKHKPPIATLSPGKVYRRDSDQTHSPMFHQIEGLVIDNAINFGNLKKLMIDFFQIFFDDKQLKLRFRPSYFPFTEPSAEVDISCVHCSGKGCRVCSNTGFLEVAGCGMVHPNVLNNCQIDNNQFQGFAFGLGVERLTMLKYHITDLRWFFVNHLDFIKQFKHL